MNYPDEIQIVAASTERHFNDGIVLFRAYQDAINFDAGFVNFDTELASISTHYSTPGGCLLLAYKNEIAVGCLAIRRIDNRIAELKRFFVQPEFRHLKTGARLLEAAVKQAIVLKFQLLRLEVIPSLRKARDLYVSFGFYTVEPYKTVEMAGTAFLEMNLISRP